MVETKNWYKSKTLWINTLAIGGGVLTILAGELQTGGTLTIAGIINVVLRVVTKHAMK